MVFSFLWSPIPSGVSLGFRACLFWPLPVPTFPFKMGVPGFLPRSIDIKLGDFPDDVSSIDIVKSLLDFFEEKAQFKGALWLKFGKIEKFFAQIFFWKNIYLTLSRF